MQPINLSDISYTDGLKLLVLRKQALDSGRLPRLSKEAMAKTHVLTNIANNFDKKAFDFNALPVEVQRGLVGGGIGGGVGGLLGLLTSRRANPRENLRRALSGGLSGAAFGGGLGALSGVVAPDLFSVPDKTDAAKGTSKDKPGEPAGAAASAGAAESGAPVNEEFEAKLMDKWRKDHPEATLQDFKDTANLIKRISTPDSQFISNPWLRRLISGTGGLGAGILGYKLPNKMSEIPWLQRSKNYSEVVNDLMDNLGPKAVGNKANETFQKVQNVYDTIKKELGIKDPTEPKLYEFNEQKPADFNQQRPTAPTPPTAPKPPTLPKGNRQNSKYRKELKNYEAEKLKYDIENANYKVEKGKYDVENTNYEAAKKLHAETMAKYNKRLEANQAGNAEILDKYKQNLESVNLQKSDNVSDLKKQFTSLQENPGIKSNARAANKAIRSPEVQRPISTYLSTKDTPYVPTTPSRVSRALKNKKGRGIFGLLSGVLGHLGTNYTLDQIDPVTSSSTPEDKLKFNQLFPGEYEKLVPPPSPPSPPPPPVSPQSIYKPPSGGGY